MKEAEWWVDDGVIHCRYKDIHKQSPKDPNRDEYNTWVWINMFHSWIVYRMAVDAEIRGW